MEGVVALVEGGLDEGFEMFLLRGLHRNGWILNFIFSFYKHKIR